MNINAYIKWLKTKLDPEDFEVSKELNMDAVDESKVYVIVKQLAGNPTKGSITLPIQLEIFTTDPSNTLDYFTLFAQTYNNDYIKDVVPSIDDPKTFESFVAQQIYMTPTMMLSDITMGSASFSRIVLFLTLNVYEDVNNIVAIKINGEDQKFKMASCNYVAITHATRVSGETLTIQKIEEATTVLTFTVYSSTNIFNKKISKIRQGKVKGTELFDVQVVRINGEVESYKMIIKSVTEPASELGITNMQVEMVLGAFPEREG